MAEQGRPETGKRPADGTAAPPYASAPNLARVVEQLTRIGKRFRGGAVGAECAVIEAARSELLPVLSRRAMHRARSTVKDFVLSYYPLMGLLPIDFLEHWDTLVFFEVCLYQMDEINEDCCKAGTPTRPALYGACADAARSCLAAACPTGDALDPAGPSGGPRPARTAPSAIATARAEFAAGLAYWDAELAIARALADVPGAFPCAGAASAPSSVLTDAAILSTHESKSFDFRCLHALARHLHGLAPASPQLLQFLVVDERLVDIGDDLVDYEDDIERNSFNILRCMAAVHGAGAPVRVAELIGQLEVQHAALLRGLPEASRSAHVSRLAAAAQGRAGALRWSFPALVLDEAAWRRALARTAECAPGAVA
ncbi:unnamed protein product [Pedinophyceae sp. YPF-701]|nr:unnamed protein product [Pedinophyceae sp. YPF-701]